MLSRRHEDDLFATLIGLVDGIATALVLAGAQILDGRMLPAMLALRIAAIAGAGSVLPLWVAEFSRLRGELTHAARELNLRTPARLVRGALGRKAPWDALRSALLAALSGFIGAWICLLPGVLLRAHGGMATLIVANLGLFAIGWWLAQRLGGRRGIWAIAMAIGADGVTVIGLLLHVT